MKYYVIYKNKYPVFFGNLHDAETFCKYRFTPKSKIRRVP